MADPTPSHLDTVSPCRPTGRGVRVATNFIRMVFGFLLGLWLVRLLLVFGVDAAAVIMLLGTGIGLCAVVNQLLQMSMTPVLGLAYHSGNKDRFRSAHSASVVVCLCMGLLTVLAFAILLAMLHKLRIPHELLWGARWFVGASAIHALVTVVLAPQTTMFLVQGRMVAYNLCQLTDRIAEVIAVGAVLLLSPGSAPANIALFGGISSGLRCTLLLLTVTVAHRRQQLLWPRARHVCWPDVKATLQSVVGNSLFVLANTLYVRLDNLFINIAGGLFTNLIFSIATQLTAYIRLLTQGQAVGLESYSARIVSAAGSSPAALKRIIRSSSRHQAILVLPAMSLLAALAGPVIHVWIGSRLPDSEHATEVLVSVLRLMLIGMTARALTEGWMNILNGAGRIRAYASPVLIGSLVNVVIVGTTIWMVPPEQAAHLAAAVFAVLHIAVHLFWLPLVLCSLVQMEPREILSPLVRPLCVTLGCLPLLIVSRCVSDWNFFTLAAVTSLYLLAYVPASFFVSLTQEERSWMIQSARFWSTRQRMDTGAMHV